WRRGELNAAAKIDHGALQDVGEFNEPINTGLGASAAISNDHWIGRANQELGGFRDRARIANQWSYSWTLWNDELLMWRNRRLLQLGIEHEKDWRHWRRHGDVVGPRCRLAEMRERTRQIIPFDEVAHRQGGILRRMDPISTRSTLRGVNGIAHHHVDRHAVAPRVVERHRRVLQADGAMRQHQERLALDLGIAIRHRNGGFFVRAGMPVDLEVVDQRLVQAAKAVARTARHLL